MLEHETARKILSKFARGYFYYLLFSERYGESLFRWGGLPYCFSMFSRWSENLLNWIVNGRKRVYNQAELLRLQARFRVWIVWLISKGILAKVARKQWRKRRCLSKALAFPQQPCVMGTWKRWNSVVSWWNYPNLVLYLPLAVSQITHTVAVYIRFERISAAQRWITITPRKKNMELRNMRESMFLFAKNGRLQMKEFRSTSMYKYVCDTYIYIRIKSHSDDNNRVPLLSMFARFARVAQVEGGESDHSGNSIHACVWKLRVWMMCLHDWVLESWLGD